MDYLLLGEEDEGLGWNQCFEFLNVVVLTHLGSSSHWISHQPVCGELLALTLDWTGLD